MGNVVIRTSGPSNGARGLATKLRELISDGRVAISQRYEGFRRSTAVINWGSTAPLTASIVYNEPSSVALAIDKLETLHLLAQNGVSVPEYTTILPNDRAGIYLARTKLRSSGGDGIIVVRPKDDVPEAPLYVRYIPKLLEYRVHVFNQEGGSSTYVQQKLRRNETEQTADQKLLRNHANGWVFAHPIGDIIPDVIVQATNAVEYLGLDFGAVDVVVGREDSKAYVLEVNTAPGLEGASTLAFYAESIYKLVRG